MLRFVQVVGCLLLQDRRLVQEFLRFSQLVVFLWHRQLLLWKRRGPLRGLLLEFSQFFLRLLPDSLGQLFLVFQLLASQVRLGMLIGRMMVVGPGLVHLRGIDKFARRCRRRLWHIDSNVPSPLAIDYYDALTKLQRSAGSSSPVAVGITRYWRI